MSRSDFRDYTSKLYKLISAPGPKKGRESIRVLYHPDAGLVRTGLNEDGSSFAKVMSFDEYIVNAEEMPADFEFSGIEITHDARIFGNVAEVGSIYESKYKKKGGETHSRGVSLLNIIYDGST